MNHYRKTVKVYRKRMASDDCPFCNRARRDKDIIEFAHCYIVPNLTMYDLWEWHDVEDHLLIIPKRHIKTLKELSEVERYEIIDQLAEYESKGYSIYARGSGFVTKSIHDHQHTHLIKAKSKKAKFGLYVAKPYLLLKV